MGQEHIKEFIKNLRKEKNLTQKELADLLGVTYQAVSKWERGLNIPDISILQEISRKFEVDMDTIINGAPSIPKTDLQKKKSKKPLFLCGGVLVILLILLGIYVGNHDHDFYFKKMSSSCKEFTLTGSAAYNQDKTSIYISNVDYCGEENNTVYQKIECTLYEEFQNVKTKISSCGVGKQVALSDFLKDVQIHVEDYQASCKMFQKSSLYLEIKAIDTNEHMSLYQVPIQLEENCRS